MQPLLSRNWFSVLLLLSGCMSPTKSFRETETKEFEYNEDHGIKKGTFYLAIVICDPQATCQGKIKKGSITSLPSGNVPL